VVSSLFTCCWRLLCLALLVLRVLLVTALLLLVATGQSP
jgi:hypothetical protein